MTRALLLIALVAVLSVRWSSPNASTRFVNTVREYAALYEDPRLAASSGYVLDDQTGGVEHWINPGYLEDGHLLDPRRPEGLVYADLPVGRRLAAVYFMLDRPGRPLPHLGAPGWHHHMSCFGAAGGVGIPVAGGACPPGTSLRSSPDMLHVWMPGYRRSPFAAAMTLPLICRITTVRALVASP